MKLQSSSSNLIQMPLFVGLPELKSKDKQLTLINSSQFTFTLKAKLNKQLNTFLKANTYNTFNCRPLLTDNNILIEINQHKNLNISTLQSSNNSTQQNSLGENQNTPNIQIYKNHNNQTKIGSFKYSFKVEFIKNLSSNHLKIRISQQNLNFRLIKINENVKYVRNKQLSALLNNQTQINKGLLTMDQQYRFLIQKDKTQFPVIGFWLKTSKNLQEIKIFQQFSLFIKEKYRQKCIFKQKQTSYFYFVKMSKSTKIIQTFLVSFNQGKPIQNQFTISNKAKYIQYHSKANQIHQILNTERNTDQLLQNILEEDTSKDQKQILQPNKNQQEQQNGMEFTLRQHRDAKQISRLESMMNYSYLSPIKQLQQETKDMRNLFSDAHQNSPQFSTAVKKLDIQSQYEILKTKSKNQEEEINKLKQIIQEMQTQLKMYKNSRMSTNFESSSKAPLFSNQLSSPQSSQFSLNSNKLQSNSPKQIRRLRQSDLRSNSTSRSDWLKNSSNKKRLVSKYFQNSSAQVSSSKKYPILFQEQQKLFESDISNKKNDKQKTRDQNLYQELPQIVEEELRDPWEYMQIIED